MLCAAALACGVPNDGDSSRPGSPFSPDVPLDEDPPDPPPPPPVLKDPLFQVAFSQALRWSEPSYGTATFRMKIPVGRSGTHLRLTFRAGEGSLTVARVRVARVAEDGQSAARLTPVLFDAKEGFTLPARGRMSSDSVSFEVRAGEDMLVLFEANGQLAASRIHALPGSTIATGRRADVEQPFGEPWTRAVGLAAVETWAAPANAFIAIGDSITEGYWTDENDLRRSWSMLVQKGSGFPFGNMAVSSQGTSDAIERLDEESLWLENVTDCAVLLGTNDIERDPEWLKARLSTLFDKLAGRCRIWGATLPPKEKNYRISMAEMNRRRGIINDWIRGQTRLAGVFEFAHALADPQDPTLFADGLAYDRVHPTAEGHEVMAKEALRVLEERLTPEVSVIP
jgi:lysophospholipase L1-like esterase